MPTTYSIEHAKSGRSSCKTKACAQKIDKGEVRCLFSAVVEVWKGRATERFGEVWCGQKIPVLWSEDECVGRGTID